MANRLDARILGAVAALGLSATGVAAATWTRVGPEGGEICRVAAAPSDPARLYAGLPNGGGIFRSEDAGRSWTLAAAGLPLGQSFCTLTVDPGAAERVFTVGFVSGEDGFELLASGDGGRTWAPAGVFAASFVRDLLALREGRRTVLLVAAADRILRSADGGHTWTTVADMPGPFRTVQRLTRDPFAERRVYAAVEQGGVHVSTDSGRSFRPSNRGLRAVRLSFLEVVADPRRQGRLWLRVDEGARFEIYRSADGGRTWSPSRGGLPAGAMVLAVLPVGGDHLLATVRAGRLRLWRSRDGGATWKAASVPSPPAGDLVEAGAEVLAAGVQGLFRTADGGATWASSARGMRGGRVNALAVDPSLPGIVFLDAVPQGLVRSLDGGGTWADIGGGLAGFEPGGLLTLDPSHPRRLVLRVFGDGSELEEVGIVTSKNRGGSWAVAAPFSCWAPTDIDIAPLDRRRIALTGHPTSAHCPPDGCLARRSQDFGETWNCLDPGLPDGTASVRGFAYDRGGGRLFAATPEGRLLRSPDHGTTWEVVAAGLVLDDLTFDGIDAQRLYALSGGAVVRSADGGATWAPAAALPDAGQGLALAADPGRALRLFAATFHGVFESLDGGDTWLDLGEGLAAQAAGGVLDVDLGPGPGAGLVLYAATPGAGLLARALEAPEVCNTIVGIPCRAGQFCELPVGQCSTADLAGVCRPVPEACAEIHDPVCGCDGVTYANACERQRAGVQQDRAGEC
jgi:photosystem II stability/assembly factor-like uncharacterized protein